MVTFKGFRDCVTGRTLNGLLATTRGDSVVVTVEAVTGPNRSILKLGLVFLLGNATNAVKAGFVEETGS